MEKIPVARLIYIDDMMYNCKDGSRNFRKGGGVEAFFLGMGIALMPLLHIVCVCCACKE